MNDRVLAELRVVVERAVRPVRASDVRKLRMREELIEHLSAIYEEEFERRADARAALTQAQERFGDSRALTDELRRSVSVLESVRYVLDRYRYHPGEPLLGYAARHLLMSLAAMAAMVLVMLPMIWMQNRVGEMGVVVHVAGVTALFSAFFSCSFVFIAEQMGHVLYGRGARCPVRAMVGYCLLSLLVFPIATALVYGGLMLSPAAALKGLLLGGIVAPVAPVLFYMLARQMKGQLSREKAWLGIEIDYY